MEASNVSPKVTEDLGRDSGSPHLAQSLLHQYRARAVPQGKIDNAFVLAPPHLKATLCGREYRWSAQRVQKSVYTLATISPMRRFAHAIRVIRTTLRPWPAKQRESLRPLSDQYFYFPIDSEIVLVPPPRSARMAVALQYSHLLKV